MIRRDALVPTLLYYLYVVVHHTRVRLCAKVQVDTKIGIPQNRRRSPFGAVPKYLLFIYNPRIYVLKANFRTFPLFDYTLECTPRKTNLCIDFAINGRTRRQCQVAAHLT